MQGDGPLPQYSFAEIAVALFQEAKHYGESNERLELLAAKLEIMGLAPGTKDRIMADSVVHVGKIAAAHALFRLMADHEPAILEIIAPKRKRFRLLRLIRSAAS